MVALALLTALAAALRFATPLGTALVPVVFGAARELAGRRAGLLAAALVAVNPLLMFYSQEARAYALFALLAALSFWGVLASALRN